MYFLTFFYCFFFRTKHHRNIYFFHSSIFFYVQTVFGNIFFFQFHSNVLLESDVRYLKNPIFSWFETIFLDFVLFSNYKCIRMYNVIGRMLMFSNIFFIFQYYFYLDFWFQKPICSLIKMRKSKIMRFTLQNHCRRCNVVLQI